MENNSGHKPLPFKHITEASREFIQQADKRRKGLIKPLKTRWKPLNDSLGGGFEYNTINSICGMSGSGKSAFACMLSSDLKKLNPEESFNILDVSLEMMSYRVVARKISAELKLTTHQLFSGDSSFIVNDGLYNKMVEKCKELIKEDIYFVEQPGNVGELEATIERFIAFTKEQNTNKGVVLFLDHALLINAKGNEIERITIFDLMNMLNRQKKKNKIMTFLLSQLNRNIESKERLLEPSMQFVTKSDIFGADSIYQFSDTVLVLHRPEILHLKEYGVQRLPTKNRVFLHAIKQREGEPFVSIMYNNLKHNELIDWAEYEKENKPQSFGGLKISLEGPSI